VEPHVKERIVGAAVLVALGVWLIPWILDGPDDVVPEIAALPEIELPAVEPVAPFGSEDVAPNRPTPDVAADQAERRSEPIAAANDSATPEPVAEPESSPAQPPEAVAEAESEATAPPVAPLASSVEPPQDRSGWSVQLGAFGERANADQLARRVSTYGFDAYVAEFRSNGATMYRVRVGGFATENQADAAASSISAHSIPARVISPE
jgi:DedD protein